VKVFVDYKKKNFPQIISLSLVKWMLKSILCTCSHRFCIRNI
jgi:hypothetical protein